jgi:hypothetical protein
MARHVNSVTTHPPKTGAKAGDSEKIMLTSASSRVAAAPSKQSRMMARPTTVPTPADIPCTTRQAVSHPTLGASAQPSAASPNVSSAARMTRRRPKASDNGPCTRLMQAKASRYSVSVSCRSAVLA